MPHDPTDTPDAPSPAGVNQAKLLAAIDAFEASSCEGEERLRAELDRREAAKAAPGPHMTYREAAEVLREASSRSRIARLLFLTWKHRRATALLAALGDRTDGPDKLVLVGTSLQSWDEVRALPVGALVKAANGDRGRRARDAGTCVGGCRWIEFGGSGSSFPVTVVSLPGDPDTVAARGIGGAS